MTCMRTSRPNAEMAARNRPRPPPRPRTSDAQWCKLPRCWTALGCILAFAATHFCACSKTLAGPDFLSRADVVRILHDEKFEIVRHVRQISSRDWASAGVLPRGRSITWSMVDSGRRYQSGDFGTGRLPLRQLLVAAKNPRYEVLCFWQGTVGGPALHVMMIQRDLGKPRLVFDAIMNNDVPQDSWTWEEVKRHIVQNKMDVLISAEHPGAYDNRLP